MKIKILASLFFLCCGYGAIAQTELAPWGNIRGIRINGQLMEFETSLRVVTDGGKKVWQTGKERQRPKYERKDGRQIVTTAIGQLAFTETVQDGKSGSAAVTVDVTAKEDVSTDGIYFCISLPAEWYENATIQTDRKPAETLKPGEGKGKDRFSAPQNAAWYWTFRNLHLSASNKTKTTISNYTCPSIPANSPGARRRRSPLHWRPPARKTYAP